MEVMETKNDLNKFNVVLSVGISPNLRRVYRMSHCKIWDKHFLPKKTVFMFLRARGPKNSLRI